ncbi:Dual specificity protein phosphatase 5 [Physocladia obscura]|uniref:protein-tyrosine-phosphatase n=1 Tax=Physocladia obscura TaxID=109957 RepID=A0AAD5XLV4_9FUNG|nr:Dual specificity protein phosphatase 5 [Physocladia obscura]
METNNTDSAIISVVKLTKQENIAASAVLQSISREGSRSNLNDEVKFDSLHLLNESGKQKSGITNEKMLQSIAQISSGLKKSVLKSASSKVVSGEKSEIFSSENPTPSNAFQEQLTKKPTPIPPQKFILQLISNSNSNSLLLDVRPTQSFTTLRIKNSANITLPALILKRIKRGGIAASFQPENFLYDETSKSIYKLWMDATESNASNEIIVYDEDINEFEDLESDGHLLLKAILSGSLMKKIPNLKVFFLDGGFNGLLETGRERLGKFLVGRQESLSNTSDQLLTTLPSICTTSLTGKQLENSPISSTTSDYVTPIFSINVASPLNSTFETPSTETPQSAKSLSTPATSKPSKRPSFTVIVTPKSSMPDASTSASTCISTIPPSLPPLPQSHMSAITPQISLGSEVIPTAPDAIVQLLSAGVTHVLNMAKEVQDNVHLTGPLHFSHQTIPQNLLHGIEYKWLGIFDHPDEEFEAPLREGIEYIRSAVHGNTQAHVLVHCKAGRSRSAAVVIGYLVCVDKMTLREAYELVRSKRGGIIPNIGFMAALLNLEKEVLGFNSVIGGESE